MDGHQAMMRFEKRRQREDETIDKFLDDLEMLRRRYQPDESNRRINLAVASNFIDGVKNDELRTLLATQYTPLSTNALTPEWTERGGLSSGGPSREPKVNFNDQQNKRRTYGSTKGRGSSAGYATWDSRVWGPNFRGSSTGNRQTSNERPTQGIHATGRSDSRNRSHVSPGLSHASQGRNNPCDTDRRDVPNT